MLYNYGKVKEHSLFFREIMNDLIYQNIRFLNEYLASQWVELLNAEYSDYYLLFEKTKCQEKMVNRILREKDYLNSLYETTQYTYNPIENYNMVEELDGTTTLEKIGAEQEKAMYRSTLTKTPNATLTTTTNSTITPSGSYSDSTTSGHWDYPMNNNGEKHKATEDTVETERKYPASGGYKENNNTTQTSTYSGTIANDAKTGDDTFVKTFENRQDINKDVHTLTRSGNIGVTTTQQMIEQERKIILKVFDIIAKYFEDYLYLDDNDL